MKAELITGAEIARQRTTVNQSVAEETAFKAKLTEAKKAANADSQTPLTPAEVAKKAADDKKLRTVCRDMETMFLNMLLTSMRTTVPEGGLLEKSNGEKIMQSMYDQQLSSTMSKAGGIGIADMLYRQLAVKTYKQASDTVKKG